MEINPKDLARARTWGITVSIPMLCHYNRDVVAWHLQSLYREFHKTIQRELGEHGTCYDLRPLKTSITDSPELMMIRAELRRTIIPLVVTRPIFMINRGTTTIIGKDIEFQMDREITL